MVAMGEPDPCRELLPWESHYSLLRFCVTLVNSRYCSSPWSLFCLNHREKLSIPSSNNTSDQRLLEPKSLALYYYHFISSLKKPHVSCSRPVISTLSTHYMKVNGISVLLTDTICRNIWYSFAYHSLKIYKYILYLISSNMFILKLSSSK